MGSRVGHALFIEKAGEAVKVGLPDVASQKSYTLLPALPWGNATRVILRRVSTVARPFGLI